MSMMANAQKIVLPENIEEADERIDELKFDVTSIQEQLHRKKRPRRGSNEDEVRMFFTWRHKAIDALRWKQVELSTLKSWKRDYYRDRGKRLRESISAAGLLYRVYRISKHLLSLGYAQLTTGEQETLDIAQAYLQSIDIGETMNGGTGINKEAQEQT